MLIWGFKVFFWGSTPTTTNMRCGTCGTVAPFTEKTGMRFFTIFFVIPLIPISGKMHVIECPTCKTRYQQNAKTVAASA